ncbi:transposase [bacterium]|nr:transposase [bacterium]
MNGELKEFLADAGYYSETNVELPTNAGLEPYLATGRLKHNEQLPPAPRGRTPDDLTPKQRMARKLRTKKGRETYAKRNWMVEPVFGQMKACRGFRQFLLRGLEKRQGEFRLVCLTHNLLKAFNTATT